jgi:hypothetical protein
MNLVQILLPVYNEKGEQFSQDIFSSIRTELKDTFGGITTYSRSPATGLWKDENKTVKDVIVIYEVMTREVDKQWWRAFKKRLEELFQQDEIIIRSSIIELI